MALFGSAGVAAGWQQRWLPASYNGVPFFMVVRTVSGGRREVEHEFAKEDEPSAEDMGRRGKRYTFTGYVLGNDYDLQMQDLMDALDTEGPGTLVHPTMGPLSVNPGLYEVTEREERGRVAEFTMNFIEEGDDSSTDPVDDTSGQVDDAAQGAADSTSGTFDSSLSSDPIAGSGSTFSSSAVDSSMSSYAPSGLAVPTTFQQVGTGAPT